MPFERAKDNQWWYSKSELREQVEQCAEIILCVNGRACRMRHALPGRDGRATLSFVFVDDRDRQYWVSLRGSRVSLDLLPPPVASDGPSREPPVGLRLARPTRVDKAKVLTGGTELPTLQLAPRQSTIFDAYIFVDWSASKSPKSGPDSIWIAEGEWINCNLRLSAPCNLSTRCAAMDYLAQRLATYAENGKRVLLGFDFAYSYPGSFFSQSFIPCRAALWQYLSKNITDAPTNANNRFQVANAINAGLPSPLLWGRPQGQAHLSLANLSSKKPSALTNCLSFRLIEKVLRGMGLQPKSAFQLFGNGSVGSQVLMGLPRIEQLKLAFPNYFLTWPFDTGWALQPTTLPKPAIINCEIWPGAILVCNFHKIKDASQMISYVIWAAREDAYGGLPHWFQVPGRHCQLSPSQITAAQNVEGWILGV